jgi:hypothetical protein
MKKTTVYWLVRAIIGLLIIGGLVSIASSQDFYKAIQSLNPIYLVAAISVYPITFILLSERWRSILHHMGINIQRQKAYQAFVAGVLVSDYTPAKIGDFSRIFILENTFDRKKVAISVIFDRLFDISTIVVIGICGVVILGIKNWLIFTYFIILILTLIFIFFVLLILKRTLILQIIQRIIPKKIRLIFEEIGNVSWIPLNIKVIGQGFILTVIAWLTHAFRIFLIVLATGQSISYILLFFIQPLISALALIPISIGGLGLVEGGLTAVLNEGGIPITTAILIAFLDRGLTMTFHLVIGGQYLLRNPINPPSK